MRYLLPVDGSAASMAAVRHAIQLRLAGLPLQVVLVNAQEAPHLYEVVMAPDPAVIDRASDSAAHHLMATAQQMLRGAGIACDEVVAHGEAARVLLDVVGEQACDAVIVGAGEPGLLDNGRLGPVALALLHHAGVPVTVVHAADEAD